jgi:23S rRNA pseudouridine1911/1915/1917 synthase
VKPLELLCVAARNGRLSSFLTGELRMSAGLINKLKWGEGIQVNGVPQFTNFPVCPGDRITVRLDEPPVAYPAETGALTILYEDDHLLVVDKPAGMLIHPSRSQYSGTLANLVVGYYQSTGQSCAFHPVTRLDRDTFGVVLLAKHAHAHSLLQAGKLKKIYHALTFGGPQEGCGIIDAPIARCPLPSLLRHVSPEGKPSVTEYRVLDRSTGLCKLELQPITGRTHQLRLHCFHMGFPILGDPQYTTEEAAARSRELGFTHQLLCAKSLEFLHPITDAPIHIHSHFETEVTL